MIIFVSLFERAAYFDTNIHNTYRVFNKYAFWKEFYFDYN